MLLGKFAQHTKLADALTDPVFHDGGCLATRRYQRRAGGFIAKLTNVAARMRRWLSVFNRARLNAAIFWGAERTAVVDLPVQFVP